MSYTVSLIDFADKFSDLVRDLSDWSQQTFGMDQERGPIGVLKHCKKECDEAIANTKDIVEYADILICWLDAIRRAGFKPMQVVEAAQRKLAINKERTYKRPTAEQMNDPIEHER